MLTIKSPISLTCSPIMTHNYTAFEERLTANYQLMQANVEATDFLHLVSAPPEIYLGEGGMTQLLQDTDIYNIQDIKFDLINNMINRIVLMEEGTLTYQDQVFISAMLRKIGVHNVDEFINQVRILKEEAVNTEQLIDLYWNNSEKIRELSEIYQNEQAIESGKQSEEEVPQPIIINLHQKILDRLQTAAIYQEIRNFNTDYRRQDSYLSREELHISEQTMLAQNMLLTQLQNITHMENEPLVYQHVNTYEFNDNPEGGLSTQMVTNRLVEASLLNVIDRVFTTRVSQIVKQEETWFPIANIMYQIADDTIERFTQYHSNIEYTANDMSRFSQEVNHHLKQEISGVKQIVSNEIQNNENSITNNNTYRSESRNVNIDSRTNQQWNESEQLEQVEMTWKTEVDVNEELTQEQLTAIQNEINRSHETNILHNEINNLLQDNRQILENQQSFSEQKNYKQETTRVNADNTFVNNEGDVSQIRNEIQNALNESLVQVDASRRMNSEVVQNNFTNREINQMDNVNLVYEESNQITNEEGQTIHEERNQITHATKTTQENNSITTAEQINQIRNELKKTQNMSVTNVDADSMVNMNSEEYLKQYNQSVHVDNQNLQYSEVNVQNEETVREQNIEIQNELNRINRQNIENRQKLTQILNQPVYEKKISADHGRIRKEAYKALENPEEVIMEFRQTIEEHEQNTEILNQEYMQILNPETREIFKTLAEYRRNPKRAIEQGIIRENAQGDLLRDIIFEEKRMREEVQKRDVQKTHTLEQELEYLEQTNTIHEKQEVNHLDTEIQQDITNRVINRIKNTPESKYVREVMNQPIENIEFVHKTQEQAVDEEILEEIVRRNQSLQQQITEMNDVTKVEHIHENHVQTTQIQQINTQAQEIAQMVQQGVQSQIGSLSDQVYQRLEKKLSNERMRRGR